MSIGIERVTIERVERSQVGETFRFFWNQKWDPSREHKPGSLVNPAVLTISTPDDGGTDSG